MSSEFGSVQKAVLAFKEGVGLIVLELIRDLSFKMFTEDGGGQIFKLFMCAVDRLAIKNTPCVGISPSRSKILG